MTPFEQSVRKQFPILKRKIRGKPLVYLDNAATTQKPLSVLDAMDTYYRTQNANVHRGIHTLSEEATQSYEGAHEKVASFIHAKSVREIIFTRGTTDSLNMLSRSLEPLFKKGDEILLTEAEHHSNLVPWQELARRKKLKLVIVPFSHKKNVIPEEEILSHISNKTKLVTLFHVSNVLGQILSIKKIAKKAHAHGALVSVDAAQSVAHLPVDVSQLGCDFLSFSGHKMYGPTGVGVLYGKESLLHELIPPSFGGDMVREVTLQKATWNDLPWKYEAGTPPIAEGIGLGAAVDFIQKTGFSKIIRHEKKLIQSAHDSLSRVPTATLYGPSPAQRSGVISFSLKNVHPHDLASMLSEQGIAIRAGTHCAMPLHHALGVPATARASFGIYNTDNDIQSLVKTVKKTQEIFS